MSIMILLLAASLLLGVSFLVFFIRAVRSGQYEDTVTPAMRVLADDDPRASSRDWKKPGSDVSKDWKKPTADLKANSRKEETNEQR